MTNGSILARDLMVRPVHRVSSRTRIRDAAAFLRRHAISGAPVEDEQGRWIGVFSLRDVAGSVAHDAEEDAPDRSLEVREAVPASADGAADDVDSLEVRDVMTAGMVTVFPDSTLAEVIRTLVSAGVHRVFVIDEKLGTLEGVITSMDVLRHLDATRAAATGA